VKKFLIKLKITARTFTQRLFITFQLFSENGLANHSAAGAYGFLLSVTPMFLLITFFILTAFQSAASSLAAPETVASLFKNISFLDVVIDEQWLAGNFLSISKPGISGIISVLCIFWASRILALSMQRGLKVIFKGTKTRNPLKDALITIAVETAVLLFVVIIVFGSQPALFLYQMFSKSAKNPKTLFFIINVITNVYPILMLGLISFLMYIFTPVNRPKKFSAFKGALFCVISYGIIIFLIRYIMNHINYNLLYGALGNLIFMLINVYFVFIFFFAGAQFAFVIDSFDVLLFTKLRQNVKKAAENTHINLINKLFSPEEGKFKKYLRTYKKGEILFQQNDTGKDVFYLLDGEVEAISKLSNDTVSGIIEYKPGSIFGEIGYLLSENRSATATAKTDVSALALPPSVFEKILEHDTGLDRTLIESITRRLKNSSS